MPNTFETTLNRIISQKSIFESLDERAVEIGVVLPLLRQVGWNTEDISEVYPQRKLPNSNKVDYDLQIDGESRILIEVKSWGPTLDDVNEKQLEGYCLSAKPELAVLTSGRRWRVYLPPTQRVGLKRKKFLDFDITEQPTEVEDTFKKFLAREKMVDIGSTVAEAKKLLREIQGREKLKETLTEAWNELANDKDELAEVLLKLVESKGIEQSLDNIKNVLKEPIYGNIVNEVPTKSKPLMPPASFAILASPSGQNKMPHTVESPLGWNKLLLQICKLMHDRHSESFRKMIPSMRGWFAEDEDTKYYIPVGDVGIYTRWENSAVKIKEACFEIVTKLGYPEDSLEIKDSKGAIL